MSPWRYSQQATQNLGIPESLPFRSMTGRRPSLFSYSPVTGEYAYHWPIHRNNETGNLRTSFNPWRVLEAVPGQQYEVHHIRISMTTSYDNMQYIISDPWLTPCAVWHSYLWLSMSSALCLMKPRCVRRPQSNSGLWLERDCDLIQLHRFLVLSPIVPMWVSLEAV